MLEALLLSKPPVVVPPGGDATDFEVLLMHFDGINGGNTFIDECGHSVSLVSAPTISTAQSREGGTSGLFNDSVCNITGTITLNADYTIEAWVYQTDLAANYVPIISGSSGSYNFPLILNYNGPGNIGAYLSGGLSAAQVDGGLTLNRWMHVAATREGNQYRLFVDGVKKADYTGTLVDVLIDRVGGWTSTGYRLKGYLDEVRVLKGKALYTDNFTPSIVRFPDPVRTLALLHFDGTNGSTIFTDEVGHTVTRSGAGIISNTKSKFGGTSYRSYNSNTASVLTLSAQHEFVFTGDFTIECWINADTVTSEGYIFGKSATLYLGVTASGAIQFRGGTTQNGSVAGGLVAGQWYHVAVVRKGTDLMLFVNGSLLSTKADTSGLAGASNTSGFDIGNWSLLGSYPFRGYIDEFRVTRGKALYTAAFTPPAAPFTLS